jgi:hypothetical protein
MAGEQRARAAARRRSDKTGREMCGLHSHADIHDASLLVAFGWLVQ